MTETNGTATWPQEELARIGAAGEIGLSSRRPDGSFAPAAPEAQGGIDAAYRTKYDRYGPQIVGSVTGPGACACPCDVTVRLLPQPGGQG